MVRTPQAERVATAFAAFAAGSVDEYLAAHAGDQSAMQALTLAQEVTSSVPAYRDFLLRAGFDPQSLNDSQAFEALPLTTKANYLQHYALPQLCRSGRLDTCDMFAVSSGSTGTPSFWPRFVTDEYRIARRFEQVFVDSFQADQHRTLAVVCFALGTWVGGLYSVACCRHLAAKGYPIVVVAPGNNKDEIFRVLHALTPLFEQTVLLGYPPFVKDVIDAGVGQGFDWGRCNVKLIFAGEVFSEEWRALLYARIGANNYGCDSASLYGTADAGVLGTETPLSISIREFLARTPAAAHELFGESRLPTLVQYAPWERYFEVRNGTLLFTGDNGIPLIRYHIADEGGVITWPAMREFLRDWGFDPKTNLPDRKIRALPFVYVFGRSHFVVSYYGANIYPENVTVALEQPGIQDWVTGKFVLQIRADTDRNPCLAVVVELALGIAPEPGRVTALQQAVLTQLLRLNSEFAHYVPGQWQTPLIELQPCGDPQWFPAGVKHRYTRP
jgi:phenylacetate-CoA ligase